MEVVDAIGALRRECAVKSSPPTNQHPALYRMDALPVTQPSVKAPKVKNIVYCDERKQTSENKTQCTTLPVHVVVSLHSLDAYYTWARQ